MALAKWEIIVGYCWLTSAYSKGSDVAGVAAGEEEVESLRGDEELDAVPIRRRKRPPLLRALVGAPAAAAAAAGVESESVVLMRGGDAGALEALRDLGVSAASACGCEGVKGEAKWAIIDGCAVQTVSYSAGDDSSASAPAATDFFFRPKKWNGLSPVLLRGSFFCDAGVAAAAAAAAEASAGLAGDLPASTVVRRVGDEVWRVGEPGAFGLVVAAAAAAPAPEAAAGEVGFLLLLLVAAAALAGVLPLPAGDAAAEAGAAAGSSNAYAEAKWAIIDGYCVLTVSYRLADSAPCSDVLLPLPAAPAAAWPGLREKRLKRGDLLADAASACADAVVGDDGAALVLAVWPVLD